MPPVAQRAALVCLGVIALTLLALLGLPPMFAALTLLCLFIIRGSLRRGEAEREVVPEGLPPGVHWLVLDSPLGFTAAEQVCRCLSGESRSMSIVLDLRKLRRVEGLSTSSLLKAIAAASPRLVIVVGTEDIVRDFLGGQTAVASVHVRTSAEAVALLRDRHRGGES